VSRKIPKWIFIDDRTWEAFCDRCGKREKMPLPMPISSVVKWSEYFGDKHKLCTAHALAEERSDDSQQRVVGREIAR
jgi:rRNA maturation protein Nop10